MIHLPFQDTIKQLWPQGDGQTTQQVFAVLDGARDPRIAPMIRRCRLEHDCLYAGKLSPHLQNAAPYIVHLALNSSFTTELLTQGWGKSWGFFTKTPPHVTINQQRKHFRTLLRVKDENDRKLIFRFYDPRVLRIYLPTCTKAEIKQFFGPIPCMLAESEDGNNLLSYFSETREVPNNS